MKINKRVDLKIVFAIIAVIVILALAYASLHNTPAPGNFIVRDGNRLVYSESGERFRFVGGNNFNLLVKYIYGSYHRMTGEEVFQTSVQYNISVIRLWATCSNGYYSDQCLYLGEKSWNKSKTEFFASFDNLVADAEAHGIYLIPVLSDAFGTFERVGGSEVCEMGSKANEEYKRFVRDVVSRYKDREIILMWEIGNEGHLYCTYDSDVVDWYDDTAAFIKNIDSNHLVSTGENNFGSMHTNLFKILEANENIDVASIHIYSGDLYKIAIGRNNAQKIENYVSYWTNVSHDELNKPIYFGEFGPSLITQSPSFYGQFMKNAYAADTDGVIAWSWLEGEDCLHVYEARVHCIDPDETPTIADELKFWSQEFQKG